MQSHSFARFKLEKTQKLENKSIEKFKIIQQKGDFYISSDDPEFLKQTMDALIEYKKNISSELPEKKEIEKTTQEEQEKFKLLSYYVCANLFFPSWINEYLEIIANDIQPWGVNCFAFGMFMSGLTPIVNHHFNVIFPIESRMGSMKITPDQLRPGDYIEINCNQYNHHGFTWLSKEWCFSSNGWNKAKLQPLEEMLHEYGHTKESLMTPSENIIIRRKPHDFNYPNEIRSYLLNTIKSSQTCYADPRERNNAYNTLTKELRDLYKLMWNHKNIYTDIISSNIGIILENVPLMIKSHIEEWKKEYDQEKESKPVSDSATPPSLEMGVSSPSAIGLRF
jgi:hypothetical protein